MFLFPSGLNRLHPVQRACRLPAAWLMANSGRYSLRNVRAASSRGATHALAATLSDLIRRTIGIYHRAANTVGGYLVNAPPTGLNATRCSPSRERPTSCWVSSRTWIATTRCLRQKRSSRRRWSSRCRHTNIPQRSSTRMSCCLLHRSVSNASGTFVNAEGRIQSFSGVVRPLGDTGPGGRFCEYSGISLGLQDSTTNRASR